LVIRIAEDIGADPKLILQTSHGRRTIDTLKIVCPEKATSECEYFAPCFVCFTCFKNSVFPQQLTDTSFEMIDVAKMETLIPGIASDSAIAVPGARSLLESVVLAKAPWAIVTSGTVPLVKGFLDLLKLPHPEHLVTAEMVEYGKPDPGGYMLGRERLNLGHGARALVLEDTPPGIRAGKAAGSQVLSVVTTHTLEQVLAAEPDWVVQDLRSVTLVDCVGGKITIKISNAYKP
jgi:glycerol 3-phosphatase-1